MNSRFLIRASLLTLIGSIAIYLLVDIDDFNQHNEAASSQEVTLPKPEVEMRQADFEMGTAPPSQASSDKEIVRSPQRLQALARETGLQLISPESLQLSAAAIHLLELNPTEVEALNKLLASFLESLRTQEILHAFVTPSLSGEEIVVAAFDRSPLVNSFRDKVAAATDPAIGSFIAEQMVFDRTLAIGNSELKLHIETGADGLDRVFFKQFAQRLDALDSETPIRNGKFLMSPNYELQSVRLLGKTVNSRYQHLFSAVDTLPRR